MLFTSRETVSAAREINFFLQVIQIALPGGILMIGIEASDVPLSIGTDSFDQVEDLDCSLDIRWPKQSPAASPLSLMVFFLLLDQPPARRSWAKKCSY